MIDIGNYTLNKKENKDILNHISYLKERGVWTYCVGPEQVISKRLKIRKKQGFILSAFIQRSVTMYQTLVILLLF